jgi:hypothetical protein
MYVSKAASWFPPANPAVIDSLLKRDDAHKRDEVVLNVRMEKRAGGELSAGTAAPASVSAACTDFVRAEKLLRTITGISDARIVAHPSGGVAMVRVHCNADASPGQIVRNVRSALFAGCGIALSSECIDFVTAEELEATGQNNRGSLVIESGDSDQSAPSAPVTPAAKSASVKAGSSASKTKKDASTKPAAPTPVRGIQIVTPLGDSAAPAASFDPYVTAAAVSSQSPRVQRILHVVTEEEAAATQHAAVENENIELQTAALAVGVTVRYIVASAAALRLESVEVRRQSGRMRCRVVISLGTDHFGAVADSMDPATTEIHLAGRVACDALRAGGFTDARFDGAAVAQINGRQHVVVALSDWMGGETMVLSGAAPLEDVPERAAAIAAIKAVLAQDIN